MKKIMILGDESQQTQVLFDRMRFAAKSLGIEYELIKATNTKEISAFHVTKYPSIVIDGEVVLSGSIPDIDALVELLTT